MPPQSVCQSCLLASQAGEPRWDHGQLSCGQLLEDNDGSAHQYRCQMGFRIADVQGGLED
nr:hypothetical protein [Petrachloros mirabilis]